MKRYFFSALLLFVATIVCLPAVVSAESAIDKAISGTEALAGKSGLESGEEPEEVVGRILNAVIGVLGTIAVGLIVYAGGLWITAAGNEDNVTKAKTLIKQVVVGIIIVGMAYAITAFIISIVL